MRYGEGLLAEIRQRTDLVALVGRRVKLVRKPQVNAVLSERQKLRPFQRSLLSVVQKAEAATAGRFFGGLPSGLRDLDSRLGGFRRSELILLAGQSGMGATSLALTIVANALRTTRGVASLTDKADTTTPAIALFSFDMSSEQLARRILSSDTGIPLWKITNGKFSEEEWEKFVLALQEYSAVPLLVAEGPMSVEQLCSQAAEMKKGADLKCVVVDGLQRLAAWTVDSSSMSNCERVVRRLKVLASELSVPVLVTSSLPVHSRDRKSPEPRMSDLSEYGAVERFSDVVLLLYREFHRLKDIEPEVGTVEHVRWIEKLDRSYQRADIFIGKNRSESTVTIDFFFDDALGLFQDLTVLTPSVSSSGD
ncbi:MAG: AAA family ATPase [Alphaproteobacteria bacterium]|nr:AAA family ATPase [Alphaproteobacteria bacterium]